MIKLKLTTIPHDRYVWDYLVFSDRSLWAIEDFCRSAGLQLPQEESDVNLNPRDCAGRICYAELIHETGRDGKTRLKRERYVTRPEALKLNPALLKIELPSDAPRPKKLGKAETASTTPVASRTINQEDEVEPDDIPF
jgi:hypothetical protein